mgnify:FL=1
MFFYNSLSSLYKSSAVVSAWTLLSRLMGFIRDILFASILGSGPIADAFLIAFRIPSLFRRFFAEGAFSAAFIPLLSKENEKYGLQGGILFTSKIASILLVFILPLIILSEIFMPNIIYLIAPGFIDDAIRFDLAIPYARIIFPYLIFIIFTSLFAACLNTNGKFWSGAAAPVILNAFLIIALIVSRYASRDVGIIMSWSVLIAGIFQMLFLAWVNYRNGLAFSISYPIIDNDIKLFIKRFIPGAFGAGITQVNLLVSSIFASQIPGAISWLYYSDRIAQLPLGIIGIAIGTALLPDLAKKISLGQMEKQNLVQERAILLTIFFSLPSSVALIYLSNLVISTLFGYGAFIESDIVATSNALNIYALAIPAFMLIKVLSPNFFARQDTKTPVKIAVFCAAINIILSWYLMNKIGYIGIAISLCISGYINALLLFFILIKRRFYILSNLFFIAFTKIILTTIIMFLSLYILNKFYLNNYLMPTKLINIFKLSSFILMGVTIFFSFSYIFGIKSYFTSNSILNNNK